MKFAWCQNIADLAVWNAGLVEEIDLDIYRDMLSIDGFKNDLDKNSVEMVVLDD